LRDPRRERKRKMPKDKIKPKNPLDPEDQEDEEEEEESSHKSPLNQIMIGDIMIASRKPIRSPAKAVSSLLKNPEIRGYLKFYGAKKMFSSAPSYID